ncbi:J domain-containing protein [Allocoleopsis franciscana]|uniref:DnaJ-class molecular chaperone with C-terminal Zn finger domain n=1 Tax=Allocoleopsis franciscana PCC 7113 TaxID=1173027 RepID=K9W862_9CYAN|nr:J domain-containing protein [Allocoleopsis franciscana]AFZ15959.1 DnaJ-class molecular chaperone with C-terminal Zn finger domain [Allocoleopsis franciscana PCC 7113]
MLDTQRYYTILDLNPGASPEEVHQGYIDLTWVWHPDRFSGHPRLQQKAHHKLQEINEAHAQLRYLQTVSRPQSFRTTPRPQETPSPQTASPTEGLYQQQGKQTREVNTPKNVKDCKPNLSSNRRHFDDWLD